mmetsp:Transcript_28347/g.60851  ORF Transcript_28347/g.60851 Transcript_28347/m.60851 type:complete len:324 (+) Transcript_28347:1707-2678(+)
MREDVGGGQSRVRGRVQRERGLREGRTVLRRSRVRERDDGDGGGGRREGIGKVLRRELGRYQEELQSEVRGGRRLSGERSMVLLGGMRGRREFVVDHGPSSNDRTDAGVVQRRGQEVSQRKVRGQGAAVELRFLPVSRSRRTRRRRERERRESIRLGHHATGARVRIRRRRELRSLSWRLRFGRRLQGRPDVLLARAGRDDGRAGMRLGRERGQAWDGLLLRSFPPGDYHHHDYDEYYDDDHHHHDDDHVRRGRVELRAGMHVQFALRSLRGRLRSRVPLRGWSRMFFEGGGERGARSWMLGVGHCRNGLLLRSKCTHYPPTN